MRAVLCLLFALLAGTPARALEQVSIPRPGGELHALLFRPAGAGPFPAVIALHGCEGLAQDGEKIDGLYQDWGERLSAAGYATVFPDSFGSREAGPQCRLRPRPIRPRVERVEDVDATRRWLQAQSWIKGDRIALMGWAQGGSAALFAIQPRHSPAKGSADFRSAVAFYPGCRRAVERAWSARVPTLVMIGRADDWTPAKDCENMIREARGRSARAEIVTYPGAYHAFDHPNLSLQLRTDLGTTPSGADRAHVGTNPAARADAIRRVMEWLAR